MPSKQLLFLLVGQLPEPVFATVIFPFINRLVSEVGVTGGDDRKIGYYAGFIESLFFCAQITTILQWGRLSDKLGRKPIICCGLFGMALSIVCFGLSKSYVGLVLSRALAGLLSGNGGVIKSAIGEVSDDTNMAEAFALLPVVWALGCTMGPLIGGHLARPHDKFPNVFRAQFWKTYPYVLPCACSALLCLAIVVVLFFFLDETLPRLQKPSQREDPGDAERAHLIASGPTDALNTATPSYGALVSDVPLLPQHQPQKSLREILTPSVRLVVANYSALSFLELAWFALLPLFYTTPVEIGGLGFLPSTIGSLMGGLGLANGICQGLLCARAQHRFGIKAVYIVAVLSYLGIFALFPIINTVARAGPTHLSLLRCLIPLQLSLYVVSDCGFGCIFVYINTVGERNDLGATNGIAQTVGTVMRAIGPAVTTSLFAFTMEHNVVGGKLVYLVLMGLTCLALSMAVPLPSKATRSK